MIVDWAKYGAKALVTFIVTFAGQVIAGVSDGSMTWQEWLVAACWSVIAAGAVFGITNGPNPRTPANGNGGRHRIDTQPLPAEDDQPLF